MTPNILPRQGSRHLLAIDLSDVVRRAWHGCVGKHRNEPLEAAPTALSALARIIRGRQPSHVVVAGEGFGSIREGIFPGYKANRPPKPEGLLYCESTVEQALLSAFVRVTKFAGLEADDVLHGAALLGQAENMPVVVWTRDKDLLAVVNDEKRIVVTNGDAFFNEASVVAKWKVPPSSISELLALAGDDTDAIPHVRGWGPGAAQKMLAKGNLEALLAPNGYWYVPERFRKEFQANQDLIRMAHELTKLRGEQIVGRLDLDEAAVDSLRLAQDLSDSAGALRRGDDVTY